VTGPARLAERLRAEGGLLAAELVSAPEEVRGPLGDAAASGPRAAADPGRYALLVEAVYEGYRLHYDEGRIVAAADPDLALLGGDYLYAFGLAELAELGDLEAVAALADTIADAAAARAEDDLERADAVWTSGARAVGEGR
jgi:hypothetical protein